MSTKTARRAKCGTETLLVGTQLNLFTVVAYYLDNYRHSMEILCFSVTSYKRWRLEFP